MKKVILSAILCMLFMPVMFAYGEEPKKVYTLKIADAFPTKHPISKGVSYFMDEAKKQSNGQLEFQYFPNQQLGGLRDLLKICQQGMTDIAYIGPSFFPGQLGLNTVVLLPEWTTSAEGSAIYSELNKRSAELQAEWVKNKVRPLTMVTTSQYNVGTRKKPITKVQDLKGLRLKSSGGIFELIAKRYGIVPVTMPSSEMYEAIQRGILDGAIQSMVSVKAYRLNELEKYHTAGLRLGGYPAVYGINVKSFQKLPADLQKVLVKVGEQTTLYMANQWDKLDAGLMHLFKKQGMQIHHISPEEKAEWYAPLQGIEEEWIAISEKRGLPARKVFELYKQIAVKIAK